MDLIAIAPWALFGVMVLFNLVFLVLLFMTRSRAAAADQRAESAQLALAQLQARAQLAESRIAEAEQRAMIAQQQISHAEERAQKAREVAKAAEERAAQAEQRAAGALDQARRADASMRQRKNEADEKQRAAAQRARALLDWARQQWEARREPDRQRAQAQQGSFQAQLEAFLELRRAPISFTVSGEVDRLAAPMMPQAATTERVAVQGDFVSITYPVDASLGFRA